jgi:hypothetical protein
MQASSACNELDRDAAPLDDLDDEGYGGKAHDEPPACLLSTRLNGTRRKTANAVSASPFKAAKNRP